MALNGNIQASVYYTGGTINNISLGSGYALVISNSGYVNDVAINGTVSGNTAWNLTGGYLYGSGTISVPSVTVAGGLAGTLTFNGNVTVNSSGSILPGTGSSPSHVPGTIAITGSNTLTMLGSGYMGFYLGATTTPGVTYDQITVGGTVSLNVPTLYAYGMTSTPASGGSYTVMTWASTANPGTVGGNGIYTQYGRYWTTATISSTGLVLNLSPGINFTPATATTLLSSTPNWSTAATWTDPQNAAGGYDPGQNVLDTVTIAMSGGYQNAWYGVNMDQSQTIATLTFTGTGRFQAQGPGTLTVTNPVVLNSGVCLYNNNSGGYGAFIAPITLAGGVLGWPGNSNGFPYVGTGNVTATTGTSTLGQASVTGTLTVNSGATVQVGDPNIGLTDQATFTGTTVNSGGILTSGVSGSTLGGPVSLAGGTLSGSAIYTGAVMATTGTSTISGGTLNSTLAVNSGATLNVNASISPTSTTVSGTLQGSGTLGNAVSLTGGTLAGATYSGAVTATSGTDTISGGTLGSTLAVNSGATLNVNASISPTSTTVNSGGILQGNGTINALALSGGTLGGTSNTLNVNGIVTPLGTTGVINNISLGSGYYVTLPMSTTLTMSGTAMGTTAWPMSGGALFGSAR